MAGSYITYADACINSTIKKFPQSRIDPFVAEANQEVEDFCSDRGVFPEKIKVPINAELMRYARNFIAMRLCEESILGNQATYSETDGYTTLFEFYSKRVTKLSQQISAEKIMGTDGNNPAKRSFSFGRVVRR